MKTNKKENKETKVVAMTKDQMIEEMKKINTKHTDNGDSRKSALRTLMNGVPVGNKTFVIVSVEDLHIDETYQRPVQDHVKTIAQEWDDMKCDPLKINYREDGNLYVWDGQHRLVALKMMGAEYVLCVITVGLTQKQEAALFGCQGNGIKKPDPYNIFKANVCSGELIDTAIKNLCDKYNLQVNKNGSVAGNLSCLTLTRNIFNKNESEYMEWALEVLNKAKWNEFPKGHSHRFINALYEIRRVLDEESSFIKRKLVSYLKETNPNDVITNAAIAYPQFNDTSKRTKLFLLDIINESEKQLETVGKNKGRFIA